MQALSNGGRHFICTWTVGSALATKVWVQVLTLTTYTARWVAMTILVHPNRELSQTGNAFLPAGR